MKLVLDLILIAIIAFCAWAGYKKGMIMGIAGIVVIVVSLYGANLLSNTFSHDVVPAMRPFLSGYTETLINEEETGVLAQMGWDNNAMSLEDTLAAQPEQRQVFAKTIYTHLGIYETTAEEMAQRAVDYAQRNEVDLVDAVVEEMCSHTAFVAAFLLFFVMLLIALTVIINLLNFSYRLPALEKINDVGGLVLGVATGLIYCCIIGWGLRYVSIVLPTGTLDGTFVTKLFSRISFLAIFLGA